MIGFIYLFLLPLATAMLNYPGRQAWPWKYVHGYQVDSSILMETYTQGKLFYLESPHEVSERNKGVARDLVFLSKPYKTSGPEVIISDDGNGLSWRSLQTDKENDKVKANGYVQTDALTIPNEGFYVRLDVAMIAVIDTTHNRVLLRNPAFQQEFPSLWTDTPIDPEFLASFLAREVKPLEASRRID